jgi:hypothetical protein
MTDRDRIAALEHKIAEAQAELAALKRGEAPKPAPQPDVRPLMSYLTSPSNFQRPTEKELRRLAAVVVGKYPKLGARKSLRGLLDDEFDDDFRNGFAWAFERLGFIGRAEKPDTRRYIEHWLNDCKDWLALHRPYHCGDISGAFMCAAIAHGDVPYIVGDMSRGVVWSVGLTNFGGTLASDAWKRVLAGELLAPTLPVMPARSY